jgi:hypothetical protein
MSTTNTLLDLAAKQFSADRETLSAEQDIFDALGIDEGARAAV